MARPQIQTYRNPPFWFAWFVLKISPRNGGIGRPDYLLNNLWKKYPSVLVALLHLFPQLIEAIWSQSIKSFSLKMASAQMCVLVWFWFFVDRHELRMIPLMGLTFVGLLIREAYVDPSERLFHEIVTGMLTMPMIVYLDVFLGWISPRLLTPIDSLQTFLGPVCVVIGLFRYHTAPEVGPEHPHKELFRRHYEPTWYVNDLWLILWFAYLITVDGELPHPWLFQPAFTAVPGMLFSTSIRVQLNPLSGNYRHRMIWLKLFTDPYEDDVRMKADYLLTGSDWLRNFNLQSLLEILSFAAALVPLFISASQWYAGDPNAESLHRLRVALCTGAYLILIFTWPLVKKLNRRTRKVFDQTIQTFTKSPKIIA